MHGCNDISFFGQIGLGVILLGLCVHVVAVASPAWVVGRTLGGTPVQNGIFYSCGYYRAAGGCATTTMDGAPGFYQATFAFVAIGLIFAVITSLCVILYFCVPSIDEGATLGSFNIFGSFCTGASIMLAVIIFGSLKSDQFPPELHELSWGFGLEVVSGFLFLLAGALLFMDYRSS